MKFEFVGFEKNRKMLKAQMSLEMIIGLLILVIVAAVVIRTFLSSITGIEDLKTFKETADYRAFQQKCLSFCREYSSSGNLGIAVAFCTTRLFPEGTRNKIGKPGDVDIIPSDTTRNADVFLLRPWRVCEDAIFCFHLFDCSEYATITMEDCRKILCEYYSERYKDPLTGMINYNELDSKVISVLKGKARNVYGSCNLNRSKNWFTQYFTDPMTNSICAGVV